MPYHSLTRPPTPKTSRRKSPNAAHQDLATLVLGGLQSALQHPGQLRETGSFCLGDACPHRLLRETPSQFTDLRLGILQEGLQDLMDMTGVTFRAIGVVLWAGVF